jgi:hypothetical protein
MKPWHLDRLSDSSRVLLLLDYLVLGWFRWMFSLSLVTPLVSSALTLRLASRYWSSGAPYTESFLVTRGVLSGSS